MEVLTEEAKPKQPIMMKHLIVAVMSLACLLQLNAALPPGSYTSLQANAPEALKLRIEAVVSKRQGEEWNETVQATVVAVTRSKTGLKVGDKIEIRYSRRAEDAPSMPGAMQAPKIEKGAETSAWLEKNPDGKFFELAAFGLSFEKAKPGY